MTSASALNLNCGYPRLLNRTVAKSARSQAACDLGTMFHAAVEAWKQGGWNAIEVQNDEVRGWLELLATTWTPPPGVRLEEAFGIGRNGRFIFVEEPQPHVYVPSASPSPGGTDLLTAGRADAVWLTHGPGHGAVVHVRDWKTGRYPVTPAPHNLQLSALALAAADQFECDGFVREIYYARDGYLDADQEPVMLDSFEAAAAWEMVERAALLDEWPRPGEHCGPCWERRMKRCTYAQAQG